MLTRILRTEPATLAHVFTVGETPTDPTGTPKVTVTAADGVVLVDNQDATATGSGSGQVTYALPGQSTLEQLTVTWTATVAGASRVGVDQAEIVGGFLFTLAEARASDASLADTVRYPLADLIQGRLEVEAEAEMIRDRADVPRYARLVLDGTGATDLPLTDAQWLARQRTVGDVRTIRSITMATRADEDFTAFTAGELAAVIVAGDGSLRRVDGGTWTAGLRNVVVEIEYGLDTPSADLRRAALTRLRSWLNRNKTGIPDRAASFTAENGGTYRLAMPGVWATGIPDVDAVYARGARRPGAGGMTGRRSAPASRALNFDPQYGSLFHGGRR